MTFSQLSTDPTHIVSTLLSGTMAQRLAEKAKSKELDHSERQRAEERQYETKRAVEEAVRTCYIMLNTASLEYHSELNNFCYALRADHVTDDLRSRLDDARREHRTSYSEAQMRVASAGRRHPDDALTAADDVHRRLSRIYGVLKRLDGRIPPRREGESLEHAHTQIVELWEQLSEMRRIMRRSIGVPARGLRDQ
ncbi:hypothetical protein PV721_21150 [Streptomyces sp. MB09-01]|uniref:hypothetical protein n=1 Tax=Streptomyces sp. MB09-01 TaxID=3028666 RepID=UPI0029A0B3B4|nr:hypothetical protein [Streptomyces sp. MB09-01]MDX3536835.1 hypothetical protein [Streptomyces sp. MB09-01]